jgi:hypothetical protein
LIEGKSSLVLHFFQKDCHTSEIRKIVSVSGLHGNTGCNIESHCVYLRSEVMYLKNDKRLIIAKAPQVATKTADA